MYNTRVKEASMEKLDEQYKYFLASYLVDEEFFYPDGQANLTQLIRIAIRTSDKHDKAIRPFLQNPILTDKQTWVITHYQIYFYTEPKLNDTLEVETTVIEANRFFVVRRFRIFKGTQLLSESYVQFAAIDFETRRMVRLNMSELNQKDLIDSTISSKLSAPQFDELQQQIIEPREIQLDEIDYNEHVNNLVYLKWCQEETIKLGVRGRIKELSIKYGNELRQDDEVTITSGIITESPQFTTGHVIYNVSQDKVSCRVQLTWDN